MNTLQNLHQHTTFCDGHNTPEELVQYAIENGYGAIGFSGHSYMSFAEYYCMSLERTKEYRAEIARLKEVYGNQIDIFCGIEFDPSCTERPEGYDYVIGSVHGLEIDGVWYEFDGPIDHFQKMIDEHFAGDGLAFAKAYFRQLARLPEYGNCHIIGHYDLVAKHRDNVPFFDCTCKEYREAALQAAEALAGKIPYFEVNTGGIARGLRADPYPDAFIIKEMKRLGFGAVISSDCHQKEKMSCYFEESKKLLKDCGYEEFYILTKNGFTPVPL